LWTEQDLNPRPPRCQQSHLEVAYSLPDYETFLRVNRRLAEQTIKESCRKIRNFVKFTKGELNQSTISKYLACFLEAKPTTYNSHITDLRRFVRDFLGQDHLISSFKMAPIDFFGRRIELPTKRQLRKGFVGLTDDREKTIFLFTASTGLRKCEILTVLKEHVNFQNKSVVPNHFTRKKRSGITFYSQDAEPFLLRYLKNRTDTDPRLFVISDRQWRKLWRKSSESAGIKITAQILRVWFATEMGECLIPDRFVDVFQGRAPRSVLAKHYTGKGLQRLKRIYDKANLKILI